MRTAYACRITVENMGAIASELPGFDREAVLAWLQEHDSGYFVRDENNKAFDCRFMSDIVFAQIYAFEETDRGEIFRRIVRI